MIRSNTKFSALDNWLPLFLVFFPSVMVLIPIFHETAYRRAVHFTPLLPLLFQGFIVAYALLTGTLKDRKPTRISLFVLVPAAVLLAIIVYSTTWVATLKSYSVLKLLEIFLFILTAYFSGLLFERGGKRLRRYTTVAIFASVLLALPISAILFSLKLPASFKWPEFMPGFTYVRIYGFSLTISIAAGIGLLMQPDLKRPLVRLAILSGLSILWATLFWTGGRGGLVSLLVTVPILAVLIPGMRAALIPAAIALIIGGAVSSFLPVPNPTFGIFNVYKDVVQVETLENFGGGRIHLWKATLALIAEHPWFGSGYAQLLTFRDQTGIGQLHTHNIVLEAALAWGWVGAVCSGFLVARLWILGLFRTSVSDFAERIPAFLVVTSMLVFALVDGVYIYYQSLIPTALCVGILLANPVGKVFAKS